MRCRWHAAGTPHVAAVAVAALVLVLVLSPASIDATSLQEERDVMAQLRQALQQWEPQLVSMFAGWSPGGAPEACTWEGVQCNKQGHVTTIHLDSAASLSAPAAATNTTTCVDVLPPGLARFEWLEWLLLVGSMGVSWKGIPQEWTVPTAFPHLQELSLAALTLCSPLPDIQPGALPRLNTARMHFPGLHTTLPVSWGASASVLPSLDTLTLLIGGVPHLPAAWATGFQKLRSLIVSRLPPINNGDDMRGKLAAQRSSSTGVAGKGSIVPRHRRSGPAAGASQLAPGGQLPAEWGSGFPSLMSLTVGNLGLVGSIPGAWVASGSFPNLTELDLGFNRLTGTLPESLVANHPLLQSLQLDGNQFSGALPPEWGHNRMLNHIQVNGNQLTGPAFPPAWLQPGAMPLMMSLYLSHNPGLRGTLPVSLAWPKLHAMHLAWTGIEGPIPAEWCKAPFASKLDLLDISGTAVNPSLPPCAAKDMYHLKPEGLLYGSMVRRQASFRNSALAAALLLAAVLAGGATAAVWLRKPSASSHALVGDKQRLLALQPEPGAARAELQLHEASSSSSSSLQVPSPAASISIRARLTALLLSEFGRGRQHAAVLPLDTLSVSFAHHLQSTRKALAGHPVSGHQLQLHSWAVASSTTGSGGLLSQLSGLSGLSQLSQHSDCSDTNRQWGLETQSLQLMPNELVFATDENGELKLLGQGGAAMVVLGRLYDTEVAIKVFEIPPGGESRRVWNEATILGQCNHPNIVQLYGLAVKGQLMVLAMQLVRGGSLRRGLHDPAVRPKLRWQAKGRQVAVQVASAVDYLHTQLRALHGDLKSSNVLLTEDLDALVTDFGVSQVIGSGARTVLGLSCTHAAPEQLMGKRCTLAADMYSFGMVLAELTTQEACLKRGELPLPRAPHDCPQDILDLIKSCLSVDPLHRPTAGEALRRILASSS